MGGKVCCKEEFNFSKEVYGFNIDVTDHPSSLNFSSWLHNTFNISSFYF